MNECTLPEKIVIVHKINQLYSILFKLFQIVHIFCLHSKQFNIFELLFVLLTLTPV